jgi:hypothetical protein
MSSGPCLCGDPYCVSCGDPSRAAFEDFFDQLHDVMVDYNADECRLFMEMGKSAVELVRQQRWQSPEDATDMQMAFDHLYERVNEQR